MGFRSRKIGNTKLFAGVNNEKHAFTVVVGDNGSGKTELLLDIFRKYYSKYAELYKPKTQTACQTHPGPKIFGCCSVECGEGGGGGSRAS